MVEETFEPGMTVSLAARRHGVAPNQLFTWRRLVVEGAILRAYKTPPLGRSCRRPQVKTQRLNLAHFAVRTHSEP
jgi:transposase-like protein